ncbi:hypothetical protein BB559_001723 [Furculomyces boomerangus]|uniref:Zn(2)-C6 fungal-type domain-containing protein n=2 Tax=Harpellales TaxID=61421 RepID=A0A2T9Z0W3_9FUNG|nr:hypothetical protein BB559_001723 [Furculomyces boomerangus]PVZ96517.1 hypothetical protein BB558_007571 [Smittium angustum]
MENTDSLMNNLPSNNTQKDHPILPKSENSINIFQNLFGLPLLGVDNGLSGRKDNKSSHGTTISKKPGHRACDSCRRRKTKCDGNKPVCGRCLRDSFKCGYVNGRARGRPPSSKSKKEAKKNDNQITSEETENNRVYASTSTDNKPTKTKKKQKKPKSVSLNINPQQNFNQNLIQELLYENPNSGSMNSQSSRSNYNNSYFSENVNMDDRFSNPFFGNNSFTENANYLDSNMNTGQIIGSQSGSMYSPNMDQTIHINDIQEQRKDNIEMQRQVFEKKRKASPKENKEFPAYFSPFQNLSNINPQLISSENQIAYQQPETQDRVDIKNLITKENARINQEKQNASNINKDPNQYKLEQAQKSRKQTLSKIYAPDYSQFLYPNTQYLNPSVLSAPMKLENSALVQNQPSSDYIGNLDYNHLQSDFDRYGGYFDSTSTKTSNTMAGYDTEGGGPINISRQQMYAKNQQQSTSNTFQDFSDFSYENSMGSSDKGKKGEFDSKNYSYDQAEAMRTAQMSVGKNSKVENVDEMMKRMQQQWMNNGETMGFGDSNDSLNLTKFLFNLSKSEASRNVSGKNQIKDVSGKTGDNTEEKGYRNTEQREISGDYNQENVFDIGVDKANILEGVSYPNMFFNREKFNNLNTSFNEEKKEQKEEAKNQLDFLTKEYTLDFEKYLKSTTKQTLGKDKENNQAIKTEDVKETNIMIGNFEDIIKEETYLNFPTIEYTTPDEQTTHEINSKKSFSMSPHLESIYLNLHPTYLLDNQKYINKKTGKVVTFDSKPSYCSVTPQDGNPNYQQNKVISLGESINIGEMADQYISGTNFAKNNNHSNMSCYLSVPANISNFKLNHSHHHKPGACCDNVHYKSDMTLNKSYCCEQNYNDHITNTTKMNLTPQDAEDYSQNQYPVIINSPQKSPFMNSQLSQNVFVSSMPIHGSHISDMVGLGFENNKADRRTNTRNGH